MHGTLSIFVLFVVFSTTLASLKESPSSVCTDRPIIGVVTEPTQGNLKKYGSSKLQASFVKWVEASGMRVAPIPYDAPQETISKLFYSVNGVLFMGGPTNIIDQPTDYYNSAQFIYNLTLGVNRADDYMPLWGTCLGFQLLAILTSSNFTLMGDTQYSSTNISLPLNFTVEAKSSRLFGSAPADIIEKLSTLNVTDNEHHNAVTPEEFTENPLLAQFYSILSTNKDHSSCMGKVVAAVFCMYLMKCAMKFGMEDLQGRLFISTMEAKQFPIYGTQWHPERSIFEWYKYQNVNHSLAAVQCSQYMGLFFAREARKNCHHFDSLKEESAALIYNYQPTYTEAITEGDYEQIYFF